MSSSDWDTLVAIVCWSFFFTVTIIIVAQWAGVIEVEGGRVRLSLADKRTRMRFNRFSSDQKEESDRKPRRIWTTKRKPEIQEVEIAVENKSAKSIEKNVDGDADEKTPDSSGSVVSDDKDDSYYYGTVEKTSLLIDYLFGLLAIIGATIIRFVIRFGGEGSVISSDWRFHATMMVLIGALVIYNSVKKDESKTWVTVTNGILILWAIAMFV